MSKAIDSRFPPPRGHHRRPGPVGRWSAGGGSDRLSPSDPLSLPDISSTPITRSRSARMRMESAIDESSRDSTSFRASKRVRPANRSRQRSEQNLACGRRPCNDVVQPRQKRPSESRRSVSGELVLAGLVAPWSATPDV
jgi:hypothetical protein